MTGKEKCELLKNIRKEVAQANGIEYHTSKCTFQGACPGHCPQCDAEAKFIDEQLHELAKSQKIVMVSSSITHLNPYTNLDILKSTEDKKQRIESIAIEEMNLSAAAYRCLLNEGIRTVKDLKTYSPSQLSKIKDLETTACNEIIQKLADLGVELAFEPESDEDDSGFTAGLIPRSKWRRKN